MARLVEISECEQSDECDRQSGCLQVGNAALDDGVRSTIGELVPAVHHADLDAIEFLLDLVYTLQEILGFHVPTVEGFGANGDRVDDVLVAFD